MEGESEEDVVDIQFKENGYLKLAHSEEQVASLREDLRMQHECGADWIKELNPQELKEKFPYLRVDDLLMGSFQYSQFL